MISWGKKICFLIDVHYECEGIFLQWKEKPANRLAVFPSYKHARDIYYTSGPLHQLFPLFRTLSSRIIACLGPSSSSGAGSNVTP